MKRKEIKKGDILIYKSPSGPEIQVKFEEESVWLRQDEIAKLYGKDRSVISRHINKIFSDNEVDKKSNVYFFTFLIQISRLPFIVLMLFWQWEIELIQREQ